MKCTEAEKQILLQDSGDLDSTPAPLTAHLSSCERCREMQEMLVQAHILFQPTEEPSVALLNTVKREIRKQLPETKPPIHLFAWKPAVAMAASVLIALGLFFAAYPSDRVGMELMMSETDLLDTSDQIISVMYNGLSEDNLAFNFLMTYEEGFEG